MALKKVGIEMVVKGAQQFARSVASASTAMYNYAKSVNSVQQNSIKLAQTTLNQANKAFANATKEVDRLTLAQKRLGDQVFLLNAKKRALNETIKGLRTAIGLENGATAAAATFVKQLYVAEGKLAVVKAELTLKHKAQKQATQDLSDAVAKQTQKQKEAEKALQDYNSEIGRSGGLISTLGKSFGVLFGSMDKGVQGSSAFARTLGIMSLRADAARFILSTLGTVISGIGMVVGSVIGVLGGLVGVFLRIGSAGWSLAKNVLHGLWEGFKKLVSIPFNLIKGGLTAVWESIKRIGEIAIGMNLSNLIWHLGTKLKELGDMAFEAAADFQMLEMRMTALVQRDLTKQLGNSFTENMGAATEKTKELLDWISQLGVKSIFSVEAIANTVTLAMAYDFTAEEAKKMTESIVAFSTGMGLTDEQMRRIIENFGQMTAQGKLTGTEMRDLARGAFVPVNRILEKMAKNYDMNTDEITDLRGSMQKMVETGEGDVSDFFEAFMQVVAEDFPNAIEKSSATWRVVQSNISDFIKSIVGWKVIKPSLDLISQSMATFIGSLMTPEVRGAADSLGGFLKVITKNVLALGDSMKPAFLKNISAFADKLKRIFDILADVAGNTGGEASIISVTNAISKMFQEMGMNEGAAKRLSEILAGVADLISEIGAGGKGMGLGEILGGLWDAVKGIASLAWDTLIAPQIEKAWDWVKKNAPEIYRKHVKPAFLAIIKFLTEELPDLIKPIAEGLWKQLGKALDGQSEKMNGFEHGTDYGYGVGEIIGKGISEWVAKNANPASQLFNDIVTLLSGMFKYALTVAINTGLGAASGFDVPNVSVGGGENVAKPTNLGFTSNEILQFNENANKALQDSLPKLKQWFFETFPAAEKLAKSVNDVAAGLELVGTFMKGVGAVTETLGLIWDIIDALSILKLLLIGFALTVGMVVIPGVLLLGTVLETIKLTVQFLRDRFNEFRDTLEEVGKKLKTGDFMGALKEIVEYLTVDWVNGIAETGTKFKEWVDGIITKAKELYNTLVGHSIFPDMMREIHSVVTTKLGEVLTYVKNTWVTQIVSAFQGIDLYAAGSSLIGTLASGMQAAWAGIASWWEGIKNDISNINISIGNTTPKTTTPTTTTPTTTPTIPVGKGCFVAGTQVNIPGGSKNIEDISVGDTVYLLENSGNTVEVSVVNTFRVSRRDLTTIRTQYSTVTCSRNHRFLTLQGWKEAQQILVGDRIVSIYGPVEVIDAVTVYRNDSVHVYNFEVDHEEHSYLVDGMVVHNKKADASAASGANFIVPRGFPNDSFTLGLSTGEQVIVIPNAVRAAYAGRSHNVPFSSITNNTGNSYSNSKTVQYNLNVNSARSTNDIVKQFGVMKYMGDE